MYRKTISALLDVSILGFALALPPSNASNGLSSEDSNKCFILYPYVEVYYPPATTSNTDCLNDVVGMPKATQPPGLEPQPGSAYVVVPELSAGNAHTLITKYTSLTFTFGPGELSTIQGPANLTKVFNFADLPCPPPDVASDVKWFYNPEVNPTRTYMPVVAPFSQLYNLDLRLHDCIVPLNQGFDPSHVLAEAHDPTLPELGRKLGPIHRRRQAAVAHRVPHVATDTVGKINDIRYEASTGIG
ncbi:MAG: hypothetical protein Q9170_003506 [Blastenia crenularia]